MSTLDQKIMYFPADALEAWKSGDLSLLNGLPPHLKDFLIYKAKARPGRRFFGEAWVLNLMAKECEMPWYNSFKWLTWSKRTAGKSGPKQEMQTLFRNDLAQCLGHDRVLFARKKALDYCRKHPKNGKPVPPDLSLLNISPRASHFIEVKLKGDDIHDGQLEALAIISKYLDGKVSIAWLFQEGEGEPRVRDYSKKYAEIYALV